MKRKVTVISIFGLLAVLIAFFVATGGGNGERSPQTHSRSTELHGKKIDAARARKLAKHERNKANQKPAARRRGERPRIENDRPDLNPTDKKLVDGIKNALDGERLPDLLKLLPAAMASTNVEIRSDLVDALGWFGRDAMLELLPLMADPDEDVAESAVDNWTMALNEVDDEVEKSTSVEAAMKVLKNEDALQAMVLELDDCDDMVALQTLVNVIEGDNEVAAAVAREHYEFMTDEEYSGIESANKWLEKNYVPDDEDDE